MNPDDPTDLEADARALIEWADLSAKLDPLAKTRYAAVGRVARAYLGCSPPADVRAARVPAKCEFEGCDRPATGMAVGRDEGHTGVGHYCDPHAEMVSDENAPEYVESCPNCGCRFGVN